MGCKKVKSFIIFEHAPMHVSILQQTLKDSTEPWHPPTLLVIEFFVLMENKGFNVGWFLSGKFFRIFEIMFFYFVVTKFYLVHDVEAMFHLT